MKYLVLIPLFIFTLLFSAKSQVNNDTIKTALLIVDIQDFYFPSQGNQGLVNAEQASLVAKEVLATFRKENQLVIHVRHQSKKGFEIHTNVSPLKDEKIITKTEVNSFNGTDLHQFLEENNVNRLVIIGMQTQMCLEGAVRAAYDFGYKCIVVEDACATRDLKFGEQIIKAADVHASTLSTLEGGGYAKVIKLEDFRKNLKSILYSN